MKENDTQLYKEDAGDAIRNCSQKDPEEFGNNSWNYQNKSHRKQQRQLDWIRNK